MGKRGQFSTIRPVTSVSLVPAHVLHFDGVRDGKRRADGINRLGRILGRNWYERNKSEVDVNATDNKSSSY